jgi:hypothetical protein
MKKKMWTDPIVDEIHRIREDMAREANYDMETLGRRLQESERRRNHTPGTPTSYPAVVREDNP